MNTEKFFNSGFVLVIIILCIVSIFGIYNTLYNTITEEVPNKVPVASKEVAEDSVIIDKNQEVLGLKCPEVERNILSGIVVNVFSSKVYLRCSYLSFNKKLYCPEVKNFESTKVQLDNVIFVDKYKELTCDYEKEVKK